MPFKKGDLNNPSFTQKRKKTLVVAKKTVQKGMFTSVLWTTVLIASSFSSKTVLVKSGIRDKNAPKRWKDMVQVSGDVTPLKRSGDRSRKAKKHSPEEKVLEKLAEDDPYASSGIWACRLLNKSGIYMGSRTVCWQLYSRADERFSYKTPNESCSKDNSERFIDMQMGYIPKECTIQSINPGVVHKNFTSQMNALFLSVSYHEKGPVEKANSFIEEFPTVWRSTLFIMR